MSASAVDRGRRGSCGKCLMTGMRASSLTRRMRLSRRGEWHIDSSACGAVRHGSTVGGGDPLNGVGGNRPGGSRQSSTIADSSAPLLAPRGSRRCRLDADRARRRSRWDAILDEKTTPGDANLLHLRPLANRRRNDFADRLRQAGISSKARPSIESATVSNAGDRRGIGQAESTAASRSACWLRSGRRAVDELLLQPQPCCFCAR